MADSKPFGDDPVDHYIERELSSILAIPTYTTTDGKEFEKREDARNHQRYINKRETED